MGPLCFRVAGPEVSGQPVPENDDSIKVTFGGTGQPLANEDQELCDESPSQHLRIPRFSERIEGRRLFTTAGVRPF